MKKLWNQYSYAIILILISFCTAIILSFQFDSFHHDRYLKVTVSDGDSLWKIADEYSDMHSLSSDQFVKWVERHNDIEGERIFPGEKIMIPVSKSTSENQFASAANE